jgi:hypothetical protein
MSEADGAYKDDAASDCDDESLGGFVDGGATLKMRDDALAAGGLKNVGAVEAGQGPAPDSSQASFPFTSFDANRIRPGEDRLTLKDYLVSCSAS